MSDLAALPKTARVPHEGKLPQPANLLKGSPSVHLDALRGFAAFSVLLGHWRDAFFVDYSELGHHNPAVAAAYLVTGLGHQWVIVFFVMSGYLVGGSVLRSVNSRRWVWRGYLLSRLTRLYIVLLPALLLGGALDWIGMHLRGTDAIYGGSSGMHSLAVNVHSTLTLQTLAANCFFLQTIALPGMGGRRLLAFGSNGSLWSLSNEFWYYLAFPLLVLLFAKSRSWPKRVACGLGLIAWGWFVGSEIALLSVPWLMGALSIFLPPFPTHRPWAKKLAISAALVLLGSGMVLGKMWESQTSNLILGLAVTLLIWVTLHCATAPLPSTYVRLARRSAHSSYTLYLFHMPMLVFLKASLHLPRALPGLHTGLVGIGLLACVLLCAQLLYEIFEKNTDQVRSWLKPNVMSRKAV